MFDKLLKWIRKYYHQILGSIGFIPSVMGLVFLGLAYTGLMLDEDGWGSELNRKYKWLGLSDAATARTIVATVGGGIISITVFSFSMVMLVINQAASQMSNRVLEHIIGDRVQKIVLGFYVGTIVFALYVLTHIRDTDSYTLVPAMTIYFLLILAIFDILLFVYFLHYTTHSFRYEQLIQRIHNKTVKALEVIFKKNGRKSGKGTILSGGEIVLSPKSGFYQSFDEKRLIEICRDHNLVLEVLVVPGTYCLKGTPLLKIEGSVDRATIENINDNVDFYYGQTISQNAYYGFFHLTEVAVKALSPGINDPGTAVITINVLTDLFARIFASPIPSELIDKEKKTRIITRQFSPRELFDKVLLPIWDYGKNDRGVVKALAQLVYLLKQVDNGEQREFLEEKSRVFAA